MSNLCSGVDDNHLSVLPDIDEVPQQLMGEKDRVRNVIMGVRAETIISREWFL